jgi:ubiquinone/menaquinone biosynthesis C-methylase UbiE
MTHFDERAQGWDNDLQKIERARVVANAIRASIPLRPGMTALEYGCGTGLLSFALQPELASITLADASEGMLAVLADKIRSAGAANMVPLRLDLLSDPLPESRFDVIYSLMTLHHVPDTRAILEKLTAILKPGGWLCIADLDAEDGSFHADGVTDVHAGFVRAVLQRKLKTIGLEDIAFSTAYVIRKRVGDREKSFPVFLLTARKPETLV